MTSDAFSDVLRLVRLRACVYFVKHMVPPWGLDIPATPNGPLHMVLEGHCQVRIGEREIGLGPGDAVLLPHGTKHVVRDTAGTRPEPGPEVMRRLMNGAGDRPGPGSTRMLCGHFEWDGALDHPMFRELPPAIVVRDVLGREGGGLFSTVVDLITAEQAGTAAGAAAIADRMGEVLFVSLLRAWMTDSDSRLGILGALNDARLARALAVIHQSPESPLDLNTLARVAGMSRTAFAVRFREVLGIPPASYLTEWRMLTARRLVVRTEIALPDIIERVGYGSDAAFNRAFKRRFGETPARLRRSSAA